MEFTRETVLNPDSMDLTEAYGSSYESDERLMDERTLHQSKRPLLNRLWVRRPILMHRDLKSARFLRYRMKPSTTTSHLPPRREWLAQDESKNSEKVSF
jgi:hypothetical protein